MLAGYKHALQGAAHVLAYYNVLAGIHGSTLHISEALSRYPCNCSSYQRSMPQRAQDPQQASGAGPSAAGVNHH